MHMKFRMMVSLSAGRQMDRLTGVPYHMFDMVIIKMLAFVFGGTFLSIYNLMGKQLTK